MILLILAAISMNMVLGENGLIKKAEQAKQLYENSRIEEDDSLKVAENYINGALGEYTNANLQKEKKEIKNAIEEIKNSGEELTLENLQKTLGENVTVVYCDEEGNETTASLDVKYASLNMETKVATAQVIVGKYVKITYIDSKNYHVVNLTTGKITFSSDGEFTHENTGEKDKTKDITIEYKGVKLKVGDYVDYKPDGKTTSYTYGEQEVQYESNLKWRVLGLNDNGNLELICANPTVNQMQPVSYNNWVISLNEMCNTLYKNDSNGTTARNLNIEDIEKTMDTVFYDYHNFVDRGSGYKYGESETITELKQKKIPKMFALEKDQKVNGVEGTLGLSEQTEKLEDAEYIDVSSTVEITQTYWSELIDTSDYFLNPVYYDLFITKDRWYALSSRAVAITLGSEGEPKVCCAYRTVSPTPWIDARADDVNSAKALSIRPVITLGQDVIVYESNSSEDHSNSETPWELK